MSGYILHRICAGCGATTEFEIAARDMAFGQFDEAVVRAKCEKCGSCECKKVWGSNIAIDSELLNEWGQNAELKFYYSQESIIVSDGKEQVMQYENDEDVNLCDFCDFELLLANLENENFLPQKRGTIASALCTAAYDEKDDARLEKMYELLTENREAIARYKEYIWDFIIEYIFPKIGLEAE